MNNVEIAPNTVQAISIEPNGVLPRGTVFEADLRENGSSDFKHLECTTTICEAENPCILIHNNNNFPVFISKNIPYFKLTTDTKEDTVNQLVEVTSDQENLDHIEFLKNRRVKFGDFVSPKVNFGKLRPNELEVLENLVKKHHESFAKDKYDVGMIKNYRVDNH